MGTAESERDVAESILSFIESGSHPESEAVATFNLSNGQPHLLDIVSEAEEAIKVEIRASSSASASDIDGWIAQATALEASLNHSRNTARSIVEEAAAGRTLAAHVEDAEAKVALLQRELELSETLDGALDTLQIIIGLIDGAQNHLTDEDVSTALEKLFQGEEVLTGLAGDARLRDCRAVGLLEKRIASVRGSIVDEVLDYWRQLVLPNVLQKSIQVSQRLENVPMTLDAVVDAMSKLGLLDTGTTRLHRDIDSLIIRPRVSRSQSAGSYQVQNSATQIHLSTMAGSASAIAMIDDVCKIVDFINSVFPFALSRKLLNDILPSIIMQLVSDWLNPSLPLDLNNLALFNEIAIKVEALAQYLSKTEVDIPSEANLLDWLKRIPQAWLARRKEASLSDMRTMCYRAVKSKKSVERVETQTVHVNDVMYSGGDHNDHLSDSNDNWDEDWGNDQEEQDGEADEDTSAWEQDADQVKESSGDSIDDEEAEAWGWDDEDGNAPQASQAARKSPFKKKTDSRKGQADTREITLREAYTVTGIPNEMLNLVRQILTDAHKLSSADFELPAIVPATIGLAALPTLLLAMYRATASTYYAADPAGQMLLYNDSVHMKAELVLLLASVPAEHPLFKRLRSLEADLTHLDQFSRRAYGREMDSQRTILTDILSSTSGFVNSTAPLNTRQYAATVQDAVNRVRDVDANWHGVLSNSARLQSLGSLTGTIVKQMISDILERADDPTGISEEQSKTLRGFCDKISELADLFKEPKNKNADQEKPSLVHVYTPDWLRFQYLGEILDASLADIRYLWTEGELRLEFRANEVIDLIQSLFADSSYRRDAIRDIKKTG